MTPFGNHGKTPMTEAPFHYVSSVMTTSYVLPQPSPPTYIPFETTTTSPLKSTSASETITTYMPFIYVTIHIPTPTFVELTTITTIA